MKKKRQHALNKLFYFCIIAALFCAEVSYGMFTEVDTWTGVIFVIAAVAAACVSVFTPFVYTFDDEGVSLRYLFLPNERYLWKDVYAIEVEDLGGTRRSLIDFFYAGVFSIYGNTVSEPRFYMKGRIRKSFRTKRLLEKYWDGTITGYFLEDVKKWFNKRKKKKGKEIEQHFTDEIVPLEREVRAEAREYVAPFIEKAKEQGLYLRTEYLYVTRNMEELRSRPDEGYTYTLMTEISRFGEEDEDRMVVFSTDLIHVRLGKRGYVGVKCEAAGEDFEFTASDVLDEIKEKGIDAYCYGEA